MPDDSHSVAKVDTSTLPEYIQRYLNGESIQTIARDTGVHRATLYRHMLSDLGNQHEDTITAMLVTRVAMADEGLEQARDACDIARARETARFARMDYERRRPALYGQRQQLTVIQQPIELDRERIIRSIDALERSLAIEGESSPDA